MSLETRVKKIEQIIPAPKDRINEIFDMDLITFLHYGGEVKAQALIDEIGVDEVVKQCQAFSKKTGKKSVLELMLNMKESPDEM